MLNGPVRSGGIARAKKVDELAEAHSAVYQSVASDMDGTTGHGAGSVVSRSLGINSALTITAMAERIVAGNIKQLTKVQPDAVATSTAATAATTTTSSSENKSIDKNSDLNMSTLASKFSPCSTATPTTPSMATTMTHGDGLYMNAAAPTIDMSMSQRQRQEQHQLQQKQAKATTAVLYKNLNVGDSNDSHELCICFRSGEKGQLLLLVVNDYRYSKQCAHEGRATFRLSRVAIFARLHSRP